MNVSVVIPTYNSAATIQASLNSVLSQTVPADEILILDDGSTDSTVSILDNYKPQVTVFKQKNRGVANARNFLCERARGDLIAFLDHDDIWHPSYLEIQRGLYRAFPNAVAYFTKHVDFYGYGTFNWNSCQVDIKTNPELIIPSYFIKRYNRGSEGVFYSMSFCCLPKRILKMIGNKPFCEKVNGVDDCYLCNLLPLYGPVAYVPVPLVAYRITKEAQSVNHLKNFALVVKVFQLLEKRYKEVTDVKITRAYRIAFAAKRRRYGKTLMSVNKISEARRQFRLSIFTTKNPLSIAKSLSLLFLSFMPALLQPKWPSSHREVKPL